MDQYSEEKVRQALAPYHPLIWQCVVEGYAEWLTIEECMASKGYGPVLYPRTKSNHVFDAIARSARKKFGAVATVAVLDEAQTVKFCFADVVVARFKKGDEDNLGQNVPTQAVLDFVYVQHTLPGFPPEAAKVEFVWAANDIGTGIESVIVVARNGDKMLWSYEIEPAQENENVIEPTFGKPDHATPQDGELPLVAVKSKDKENKGK